MNLFFLFLAGFAFVQLASVHAVNLNEYLNEKLQQSKIEFIKIHIQQTSPVQEKSYRVHWDKSWRVPLTSSNQPFTINMFDEIFILDGNRVMTPFFNGISEMLHEIYRTAEYPAVKFVRSILWKDTTYLLVCYELGLCSLHTKTLNEPLRFRHTIGHRGISMDAKFFTQDNQLYLVIANNADKFSVPSIIYLWRDTYMDVVDEVMTVGAMSITAFEHRQSTIIVFAQSVAENPWIVSEVYEFRESNAVKIQFLSTALTISVHHYIHSDFNFILMMNELEPSSVLCWDGREFLDWFNLPEIEPHSLINIFHMDGNTFVVAAYNNSIQLYKFHSTSDWKREDIKRFKDNQKIIDMAVLIKESMMTVMLIIQESNTYWVEQWEAELTSVSSDSVIEDADVARQCLLDLIEILQARMPAIKEAEASWKYLLSSTKNVTISEPVRFDNLTLESGTIESIEVAAEGDILSPYQIEKALDELGQEIEDLEKIELAKWQKGMETIDKILETMQDKIVADDVYLEELEIDKMQVDFINDVYMRSEKMIQPEDEEILHVTHVIVEDLEVDSLCGILPQFWHSSNKEGIAFVAANNFIEFSNDTVTLHSDLIVPQINITSLNGTIVNKLIDDLFIINRTQKIKGTITFENFLEVTSLTTQMLNGVSADKLMTTITNQTFDDFYVKNLEIGNLYAETINGVLVEEAARKSRENVIKGKVKLANLHVTENFAIDTNASLMKNPYDQPLQIYENVTILGDLHLQNIKIEKIATLTVGDVPVNVSDMFNSFWTKSSDQTITEEIILEGGLTIDRLNTKYLNGFTESDFLYTTMEEIPREFTNLRFENFHVEDFFHEDEPDMHFFFVKPDSLIIQRELHVQSLHAKDIITLAFNGINIDDIINGTRANISNTKEIQSIRARRIFVDNLDVRFLNGQEVFFENGLRLDDDHQLLILKTPEFHVQSLEVERINGIEMNLLTRLNDLKSSDLTRIIIDGDLTVENLTVGQVDGQSTESFLEELAQSDIVLTTEKSIENLVVQNITLKFLRGQNFNDLIASVFSKSKKQTIPEHFSAHVITSDNVTMNYINGHNASQLMWVDEPLTITGNVTFSDLFVEGDVITSKINGRNVHELYESLLFVPTKNIDLLTVNGSLSWETPLTNPASMSHLLKNAVTKDKDQAITGKVTFAKDVRAWAVNGEFNEIKEIQKIVSDTVIDSGEEIVINGRKFFNDNFVADSLTVNGNLGIVDINGVNILEFNNSIVRKDREDRIAGPLIFLKDVTVEKLYVNNVDLNASIRSAVRSSDVMPDNIFFEDLTVVGDVYLTNLDGINFNKFADNRVTLTGNHDISCDIKFNGVVTVTGNANIKKINGIRPSNFVLNDINEMQLIYGMKTFERDLIVKGNITAPRINNIDIIEEFDNSVQNSDQDVDIFGDLIFKENVCIKNMSVSGLINDVDFRSIISDSEEKVNETLQNLQERWKIIEKNIEYSTQMSKTLRNVFFYLEIEEDLKIPGTNVNEINIVYFDESTIRLNMYSEQPGRFCGLPNDCPCPYQTVIDLIDKNVQPWQVNHKEIVKNFHDSNGVFGINVISNAISSSKECTSMRIEKEFITISLMKSKVFPNIFKDVSGQIEGYLKDAKVFKHDGNVYIFLAINYDKAYTTDRVNFLIYKLDMITKNTTKVNAQSKLTLVQKIPTDGAWSIQIFKIDHEMFLLIGCFGKSSESLLYRFDPTTEKFEQLRTFTSRSRYVKSLSQGRDHFVLLDNPDMNAVNIYKYNATSRNFYIYQSIFHVHQINGIECFYTDDFDNSDVFVIVTTQGGRFYIYEYMFAEKFQIRLQHAVDGLRTMMPFYYMNRHYIFAGTNGNNIIFRIVKQGPH